MTAEPTTDSTITKRVEEDIVDKARAWDACQQSNQRAYRRGAIETLDRVLESVRTMTRPMLTDWLERERADAGSPKCDSSWRR